ncbi:MAG: hypothetical protein MJZ78_07265 [Bacteroidales bacterium]|nr:hypothetical protein [Bacteroidales bacterium]
MKKLFLTLAIALVGTFAFAQNVQVQNAFNNQKAAQQYIDQADAFKTQNKLEKAVKQMDNAKLMIKKAKDAIDAASQHEATINQAKTWHYLAVIYYKIGLYPEFRDLDGNAFEKSLNAFGKIMNLDPKYYSQNAGEFQQYIASIGGNYYDMGANFYNEQKFEDAYINFKKAYDAAAVVGGKDNSALLNAAFCAMKVEKYEESINMLNMLVSNGYEDPSVYQSLAICYRSMGDNDKMIETIQAGRAKYPDDANLMNEMINSYITVHREGEIIDQIIDMAQKNPTQPVYYFILGTIYANSESELFDVEKTLESYNKVIEIDPNYVDAYINAGSILIDRAAEKYTAANDLPFDKVDEYNAMMAEGKAFDERALPYVEKAYELLKDDPAIKQALKTLYVRLKMNDKATELN